MMAEAANGLPRIVPLQARVGQRLDRSKTEGQHIGVGGASLEAGDIAGLALGAGHGDGVYSFVKR
jgi:hypothetical protein